MLAGKEAERVFNLLKKDAELVYEHYMEMLNEGEGGEPLDPERSGLARELARMNLSLAFYTQWYWKTNLHNLMHFLSLRADAHAQYEIRVYADVMIDTLKRWCPICHDAFMEYRMGGAHLSKTGLAAVKRMIAGEKVDQKSSGLNPREWRELMAALGPWLEPPACAIPARLRLLRERPRDDDAIEEMNEAAFGPDRSHKTVYRLREDVQPIKELCFVAIDQKSRLVASIRNWPILINERWPAIMLGPLAISPELRGLGYGKALMWHSMAQSRLLGHSRIILVGDPEYYNQFGFRRDLALNICSFPAGSRSAASWRSSWSPAR